MPAVVRATFAKMHFLKVNTRQLTTDVGLKFSNPMFNGTALFR